MTAKVLAGPNFGWKRPPPSNLLATTFAFSGVRPGATVEREAGISAWPRDSAAVIARIADDSTGGRLVISALIVYDSPGASPRDRPQAPPSSPLAPVAQSDAKRPIAVRAGQALGVRLRYTAGTDAIGARSSGTVEIVADGAVVAGLSVAASDLAMDQTISWVPVNQWGIQRDPTVGENPTDTDPLAGPWWAGHVNCALVLGPADTAESGSVLAGTDGGGVWRILQTTDEVGELQAQPLTDDWEDTPQIIALCQGPDDPQHVYAAAWGLKRGSLRETSVVENDFHSIYQWREITPPQVAYPSTDYYAPAITQVAVTRGAAAPKRIVVASTGGLYWADIPAPGGAYLWNQVTLMADGTPLSVESFSGVTIGAHDRVIASAWGGSDAIFWGDWSAAGLVMNAAATPFGPSTFGRTSVATALSEPDVHYAVAADFSDQPMLGIMQSNDNGQTWVLPGAQITLPGKNAQPLTQVAGGQGYYNNCIAVSPFDSSVVAVGWQAGHFVSRDGASTFTSFSDPSLHSDVHGLYFDPWQPETENLYICSDGGVCMTPDQGDTFDSSFNRNLANLECYATYDTRDYYGTLDATFQYVAVGVQDNGNVYCALWPYDSDVGEEYQYFPSNTPWMQVIGGDGGSVTVLSLPPSFPNAPSPTKAQLCSNEKGGVFQAASIENVFPPEFPGAVDSKGVVTFQAAPIPWRFLAATGDGGLTMRAVTRVLEPSHTNVRGQLMYAVGSEAGTLYVWGLFADDDGSDLHWELLGYIDSNGPGDSITALAPLPDGSQVLVATTNGLSGLIVPSPIGFALATPIPFDVSSYVPSLVTRIVFPAQGTAFAAYNWGTGGMILRYDGQTWQPAGGAVPVNHYFQDGIYGLAVNKGFGPGAIGPPLVFASVNDGVFVSRDLGDTWVNCSLGLPACPQGADIQCADITKVTAYGFEFGGSALYLATWGRSVWRATLTDAEAHVPPIAVKPISGS